MALQLGESNVEHALKRITVNLGEELEIDCDSESMNGKSIYWQKIGDKDRPEQMAENVQVNENRLMIRDLRMENGGLYRCILTTESKPISVDHLVIVQGP